MRKLSAPSVADRFGLGWRPELSAAILASRDRIDVVELIADEAFDADAERRRALRTLARQTPVLLHGTGLGPASTERVESVRLERLARLAGDVEPESWSEHVAFVRAGGHEIGHLACPPRTSATVEGTARNLLAATRAVGAAPDVENIATLIDPPASALDEWEFLTSIISASGCGLLLDLHNLYANAMNFGRDPLMELARVPLERVHTIHIAGGCTVAPQSAEDGTRILDDHLHAVPDPVFALLEEVASRVAHPLTVVLERDGVYPPFTDLLAEIDAARKAVQRGRARVRTGVAATAIDPRPRVVVPRSPEVSSRIETLLARAYLDEDARASLERDPAGVARAAGLPEDVIAAFEGLDRAGLSLAAESFRHKRRRR